MPLRRSPPKMGIGSRSRGNSSVDHDVFTEIQQKLVEMQLRCLDLEKENSDLKDEVQKAKVGAMFRFVMSRFVCAMFVDCNFPIQSNPTQSASETSILWSQSPHHFFSNVNKHAGTSINPSLQRY